MRFLTIAFSLMILAVPAAAQDRVLAVLGGTQQMAPDGGAVVEVDITTAAVTVLNTPSPGDGLTGIAQLNDGRVFVVTNSQGATGAATLIEIDPVDASVIQVVGPITVGGNQESVQDLAANPLTGELYAASTGNEMLSQNELFVIDPATAEGTVVGLPAYGSNNGYVAIAFTPDGRLWGKEANDDEYWEVDPADASIISGPTATTPDGVGSIGLGSLSDGRLLLSECCSFTLGEDLYILDLTTQTSTLVGSMGTDRRIHDFIALGFPQARSVPTDSPAALLLLVLAVLAGGFAALQFARR